jgi:anti-sigma factor RsiW
MLPDLLTGEVSATEEAATRAHLEACSVCTRFGGQYSESIAALRGRFATADAPPGFAARLRQRRER